MGGDINLIGKIRGAVAVLRMGVFFVGFGSRNVLADENKETRVAADIEGRFSCSVGDWQFTCNANWPKSTESQGVSDAVCHFANWWIEKAPVYDSGERDWRFAQVKTIIESVTHQGLFLGTLYAKAGFVGFKCTPQTPDGQTFASVDVYVPKEWQEIEINKLPWGEELSRVIGDYIGLLAPAGERQKRADAVSKVLIKTLGAGGGPEDWRNRILQLATPKAPKPENTVSMS